MGGQVRSLARSACAAAAAAEGRHFGWANLSAPPGEPAAGREWADGRAAALTTDQLV